MGDLFQQNNDGDGSEQLEDLDFNFGWFDYDSFYNADLDLDSSGHTTVESCHSRSYEDEDEEDPFELDDGFALPSPLTPGDFISDPTFRNEPAKANSYRQSSLGWFREESITPEITHAIFSPDNFVSAVNSSGMVCLQSSSEDQNQSIVEPTNQAPHCVSYNENEHLPSLYPHGIVAMNASPVQQDPVPRLESRKDCNGSPVNGFGPSERIIDFSKTTFAVVSPAASAASDSDSVEVVHVDCKLRAKSTSKTRSKKRFGLKRSPKTKLPRTKSPKAPSPPPPRTKSPQTPTPQKKIRDRRKDPKVKEYVKKTNRDVLCGRGGESNHHPGNKAYRQYILERQPLYKGKTSQEKFAMSKKVVDWVIDERKGRFLKQERWSGRYFVVTEAAARQKASQALREDHTPEGRALKKSKRGRGCRKAQV